MPLLSTSLFGSGPLYNFVSSDPNAFLVAGTTYYQTALNNYAVYMSVSDQNFTIAGAIGSRWYALYDAGNGTTDISVTSTGYVAGDYGAIAVVSDHVFNLVNSGTIESGYGDAIFIYGTFVKGARITNVGTISSPYAEAIQLAAGNDVVVNTGTIIGNVILGGGDDRFDTHLGRTTGVISGGAGNDTYIVGGGEQIVEDLDAGIDTVQSYSDYQLGANIENLTLLGTALVGNGNRLDNRIIGNGLDNVIAGYRGNDFLDAGSGDDIVRGGFGNDVLYGNNGDNKLFGGAGDDTLLAGSVGDTEILNGGAGVDQAQFYNNLGGIVGNLTTQSVSGEGLENTTLIDIEGLYGSNFADDFTGSNGANYLFGNGGDDKLAGLDGDDRLDGFTGADTIDGGTGNDTVEYIYSAASVTVSLVTGLGTSGDAQGDILIAIENLTGSAQADTLTGNDTTNVLRGGAGDDMLFGGKGADTLVGDAGNDTMNGGLDPDVYGFQDIVTGIAGGWGSDAITGFRNGQDKISFVGASAIHAFADLAISSDGADTLITKGADVIRLTGFPIASLDATDFLFG